MILTVPYGYKQTAILLLVLSLGLQWALLQTVAWTGMLVAYSRDASLKDALVKTFDGKHPCALCLTIRTARAENEQESNQDNRLHKLDPGLLWQTADFWFLSLEPYTPGFVRFASTRLQQPPKPPPRPV